jgi:hypothetical protein
MSFISIITQFDLVPLLKRKFLTPLIMLFMAVPRVSNTTYCIMTVALISPTPILKVVFKRCTFQTDSNKYLSITLMV